MGMQVDEPRRRDEAGCIDHGGAGDRLGCHNRDFIADDADIPDLIERGLGVDNTRAFDDEVVGLRLGQSG